MTASSRKLLLWSPRVLGLLVSLFLGAFALDAFSEGSGIVQAIPAFLIHAVPALLVLAVIAVSWRWEWVGAVTFIVLAALYIASTAGRPGWWLVIAGPLVVLGGLFALSWHHHDALRTR